MRSRHRRAEDRSRLSSIVRGLRARVPGTGARRLADRRLKMTDLFDDVRVRIVTPEEIRRIRRPGPVARQRQYAGRVSGARVASASQTVIYHELTGRSGPRGTRVTSPVPIGLTRRHDPERSTPRSRRDCRCGPTALRHCRRAAVCAGGAAEPNARRPCRACCVSACPDAAQGATCDCSGTGDLLASIPGVRQVVATPNGYLNFYLDRPSFLLARLRGAIAPAIAGRRQDDRRTHGHQSE